jgi:transposase
MARYKTIDTSPRLLPVSLQAQLLPGTFEYALDYLFDREIDLSSFDARFRNDACGASAYPPAVLLKIILFAYSRGIVSSRAIERACREHVTFIALSGDQAPHFTTLAAFVSSLGDEIARVFTQVLAICDRQGLIGREMFAIDGVKLPSNASKHRSGTRADFLRQAQKLEAAAKTMLERHRDNDGRPTEPGLEAKAAAKQERLGKEAALIRQWLTQNPEDRPGAHGGIRKSNRTDNESAKMATDKGVIQGYTGVAAVDDKHQIIVEAQAHGTGNEQALLMPVVEALQPQLKSDTLITADAGYHSQGNLQALDDLKIDALIADKQMRQRDERLTGQDRYQALPDPLHDKSGKAKARSGCFRPADFIYDAVAGTCVCPAGKSLYQNGSHCRINGYEAVKFRGAERDCLHCPLRKQCLRHPDKTKTRQVAFFLNKAADQPDSPVARMRRRIDSPQGRARYGQRFSTVEPVFGNLRHNKRLNRFTLRSRRKVDAQWKLFCLVHNIEKLSRHGYAA